LSCIGAQPTLENIRAMKAEKFKELAKKRNSEEYQSWFLRYNPRDINEEKNKLKRVDEGSSSSHEKSRPLSAKKKAVKKPQKGTKRRRKPSFLKRNGLGFLY
jgi:hypothetical protein